MAKDITVVPKCQSNNEESKAPSLVRELETAKILQKLSRRSALGKIVDDSHYMSGNSQAVSPTPSCEETTYRINKRRICDIESMPHGSYDSSSVSIGSNKQKSTEPTSQTLKLPFLLYSDDDDLSSYTVLTKIQESKSELSGNLSVRDGEFLSLGKVSIKPLMPPPQMHRFSNFSNPICLLLPTDFVSHPPETAKVSNHFVTGSPSAFWNTNKRLVQNEIPLCYPIAPNQKRVSLDQASSSSNHAFQNLFCPQHIVTPSSTPSYTNDAQQPSSHNNNMTKKRKVCRMNNCESLAAKQTPYCTRHAGHRKCEFTECSKFAQGKTCFCISHGGGRRCLVSNCTRGARDQKYCAAHGGGRRCRFSKCTKLAIGGGFTCTAHGGGKRCQIADCAKSAQSSSNFCVRHGGGRKCSLGGCDKVARGKNGKCNYHENQIDPSTV